MKNSADLGRGNIFNFNQPHHTMYGTPHHVLVYTTQVNNTFRACWLALAISSHYGVTFPKSKDAFRRHFIFKARNIYWYAKFFLQKF